MAGSTAGRHYTENRRTVLISKVWKLYHELNTDTINAKNAQRGTITFDLGQVNTIINRLHSAVHRLQFLEMVVLGLTFKDMHDAKAYTKFVEQQERMSGLDYQEIMDAIKRMK